MRAFKWSVLFSLCALVQPFDEDPALFLLNDEMGGTITTSRQRIATGGPIGRAKLVGWTNDRASASIGPQASPNGVQAVIDDPELLQTLYGHHHHQQQRQQQLGEGPQNGSAEGKAAAKPKLPEYRPKPTRILGTFVIQADYHTAESLPSNPKERLLGETNATSAGNGTSLKAPEILTDEQRDTAKKAADTAADGALSLDIEAAKRVLEEQNLIPEVKQIALKYLKEKDSQFQEVDSATVKKLSQQLFQAKLANAEMYKLKEMAAAQLRTPAIGTETKIGLGETGDVESVMTMKVDGVEFDDGGSFTAPEGHIVSAERCERFLEKYNTKAQVRAAHVALGDLHSNYTAAVAEAKKLSKIALDMKEEAKAAVASTQKSESKEEEQKKDQELVQTDAAMAKAAAAVRAAKALKQRVEQATKKAEELEEKEVADKQRIVRSDNLAAREAELAEREKSISEREFVYRTAAGKLREAAQSLENAQESQAVMDYPAQEKQLKARIKEVEQQEHNAKLAEQANEHKARMLAARMKAFGDAVQKIIDSSAKSSAGIADDWERNSEAEIGHEVDGFTAALTQIKNKFSSPNKREATAAKDGAAIINAVHEAVKTATNQLHHDQLIKRKQAEKHVIEDKIQNAAAHATAANIARATTPKAAIARVQELQE